MTAQPVQGISTLVGHSLRRMRVLLLSTGLILFGFQILLTLVATSFHKSGSFSQLAMMLPDFVRKLMGPSFLVTVSFAGVTCAAYYHVAVMCALTGLSIAIGTEPAGEIESGFIDLLLSRSVARYWIITRSVILLLLSVTFFVVALWLGEWAGLHWFAPRDAEWPTQPVVRSLTINFGALLLSWGSVALAIAAALRRRSVAGSIAGVLALIAFLLDYLGRLWKPAEQVARLSLFRYYVPFELLMARPLSAANLEILLGTAVAGFAVAYFLYARRDV